MNSAPYGLESENKSIMKYFLIISILGTFFLILMMGGLSYNGYYNNEYLSRQDPLIFILFILICFFGILAAIFPENCVETMPRPDKNRPDKNKVEKTKEKNEKNKENRPTTKSHVLEAPECEKNNIESNKIKFEGHHPSCEHFENHVFHIKTKAYCAGCSGLMVGAVLSIIGALTYFFYGFPVKNGIMIFSTGIILVILTLYLPLFKNIEKNVYKFIFNVLFVLGAFMGLISLDVINKNLSLELYYLILILIWIMTRITISRENHGKICNNCNKKECF